MLSYEDRYVFTIDSSRIVAVLSYEGHYVFTVESNLV